MLRTLMLLLACALPAAAQETRSVTDHAGFTVAVPRDPQRVVSLSDWTTTVMAHELGLPLIASGGRRDPDGGYHIRSARELHGLEFGPDLQLASVHAALDLERIAALKPDLILGMRSDMLAYRGQLAQLAPVLLFDIENGRDMLANYADFADWIGRRDRFDTLLATYRQALADRLNEGQGAVQGTYLVLRPNPTDGSIALYRDFGAVTVVLDDLGYTRMPIVAEIPATAQRANFSAELLSAMDADLIVAGHMEDRGQTAATSLQELEQVAPGAAGYLRAIGSGRFLSLSRFHTAAPSFAALSYVLDHLPR